MFRTALVGLKPDASNEVLMTYAVELARARGLRLQGIAVLDKGRVVPDEAVPLGGGAFKAMRDEALMKRSREQVAAVVAEFASRCQRAGVVHLELAPEENLEREIAVDVQRCDVLLVGHTGATSASGHRDDHSHLNDILKGCPRPAIVVPAHPSKSNSVVVAYDGSIQAARALESFVHSGLMTDATIHVLASHTDEHLAQKWAQIAIDYLHAHDHHAVNVAVSAKHSPSDAILQAVQDCAAQMLVMGAYGQPAIREFFFGSVTKNILRTAAVPMFVDH